MPSEAEIAERFYGNASEAPAASQTPQAHDNSAPAEPAPPAEHAPRTEQELADSMYPKPEELPEPDLPPEIKELRESDPERKMFSPQSTFAETLPDDMLAEVSDLDDKAKAAAVHEFRELSADLDLAPNDVRGMIERASMLGYEPRDPIAQREEAVGLLNAEFGQGAHQAWLDARALVARDPRVGQIIDALGLGDDPQTVMLLAHAARRQRTAGKLK